MKKILALAFFLILIGAACSQSKPVANQEQKTAPTVIRKPTTEQNLSPIYDFCEKNGNEIIIRFDSETQSSKAYCRFPDTTECPALEYQAGTCLPGQNSQTYKAENTVNATEVCIQTYDPVCGEDGITYTNDCVAKMQGIKITKTGVCAPVPPVVTQPSLPLPEKNNNISPINSNIPTNIEQNPDWLELIKKFVTSQTAKSPRTRINRCSYNGQTAYLQLDTCTSCYSTLYNSLGRVICYPDHDFSNSCPNFSLNTANCTRIWTDNR